MARDAWDPEAPTPRAVVYVVPDSATGAFPCARFNVPMPKVIGGDLMAHGVWR